MFNYNKISLPHDAKSHSLANLEWWYFYTYLRSDQGKNLAIMGSFFRIGESELLKGHYLIYTVIDLNSKTHKSYSLIDNKLRQNMISMYLPFYLVMHPFDFNMWNLYRKLLMRQIPYPHEQVQKATINRYPFALEYGQNNMTFFGEHLDSFEVYLQYEGSDVNLRFTPLKPIALIGGDGKPNNLYYYSFTRNQVSGQIGSEIFTGTGWFDHQWGRDYNLLSGVGWNWFGLQLDDGRELLLNETRYSKTGKTSDPMANLIEADGSLSFTKKVTFEGLKQWISPRTKAKYPLEWKINIPDFSMELYVKSKFETQVIPIIGPMQEIWEGAVTFTGTEKGRKLLGGNGFMELVNYAYSAYE